jgi:glucose-6-phosphate isomerase
LHTALRADKNKTIMVHDESVIDKIDEVKKDIEIFSDGIRQGVIQGYSGKPFTDIVNIGIGGSDLGPHMVCDALRHFSQKNLNIHFVSNVDPTHISDTLSTCNPETTIFIIASKTFTTEETLANANAAKAWFLQSGGKDVSKHFVALSTNYEATAEFGIHPDRVFVFWDWIGGRFSLWSAIGLSIAISIGYDGFCKLLDGAFYMDMHMYNTPLKDNIPVILALIDIINTNCYSIPTQAILPYDEYLRLFPSFLQQMLMESNGKYITKGGNHVQWQTSPIVWGQPGTDSQHSFFQLLHQGTQIVNAEFIICARSHNPISDMHERLIANCFAQSAALMLGKSEQEVLIELQATGLSHQKIQELLPHKIFQGNRPSTTILMNELNPFTLGWLIALYEHRTFVQGVLWDICSYDQWGVELGKQLAKQILPSIKDEHHSGHHDSSTNNLIEAYKAMNIRGH